MATKDKIVKNGVTIQLTDNDLQEIAKTGPHKYVNLNHTNEMIGRVIRTWVEGDAVKFELGIFEGLSKEIIDEVEKMDGLSMEFFYNPDEPAKRE